MYCEKCGAKCADTDSFCQKCGSRLTPPNVYAQQSQLRSNENLTYNGIEGRQNYNRSYEPMNSNAVQARQATNADSAKKKKTDSYFDGNGFQYAGFSLLTTLIAIFTLGFGIPWANCLVIRWETRHTVIDGKRLRFNGSAGRLFVKMIVWNLIITGILATPVLLAYLTSFNFKYGMLDMYKFANWIPIFIIVDLFLLIFGNAFYYVYIKKWVISHTVFSDKIDKVGSAVNSNSAPQSNIVQNDAVQTATDAQQANKVENKPQFDYQNNVQQRQTKDNNSRFAGASLPPDPYPLEYRKSENDSSNKYMAEDHISNDVSSSSYNYSTYTNYGNENLPTESNTNNYEDVEEKIFCPVCSAEIPYGISSCPNCGSEFRWD